MKQIPDSLRIAMSEERLTPYAKSNDPDEFHALARYSWNTLLSESLYPPLQSLEITFRNSVHDGLVKHFQTQRWFDSPNGILSPRQQTQVDEAKKSLGKRKKQETSGAVVAELSFGFWTSLLNSEYEQTFWTRAGIIKSSFPKLPRRVRNRAFLSRRFNRMRHLRNRVFHYEPIWHWQDLEKQHEEIMEAIGWMNPTVQEYTRKIDRFPDVYDAGYRNCLKYFPSA